MFVAANGRVNNAALEAWGDKDIDVVVYVLGGGSVNVIVGPGTTIADVGLFAGAKLGLKAAAQHVLDIRPRIEDARRGVVEEIGSAN
jgi:hypothetical protein